MRYPAFVRCCHCKSSSGPRTYLIPQATLKIEGDWSWRTPFVIQWVWVIPLFLIVYFAPSSPWWLVRKGRHAEAEAAVRRLTNPEYFGEQDVKNTVAMMQHTNQLEIEVSEGTSYIDCFRGIDRRRTEIVMMIFASQLLSGQNLIGQGGFACRRGCINTDFFRCPVPSDGRYLYRPEFLPQHGTQLHVYHWYHGLLDP